MVGAVGDGYIGVMLVVVLSVLSGFLNIGSCYAIGSIGKHISEYIDGLCMR